LSNLEDTLRTAIRDIQEASFSKASLEILKQYPKTLQPVFVSGSDNEKILATQAYGKLLEKFGSFSREIKNKQIKPNDEELNVCEEVIEAVYNSNEKLLRDAPEIANAIKINEIQPVLSDLKKLVHKMRYETPPKPSNGGGNSPSLGTVVLVIVLVGIVALLVFLGIKKFSRRD
jgi:hypothetical protein